MSTTHGVGVRLTGVERRYGDRVVLRGVNLEIRPGEIMAILGQSGTGKSVLLRQIIGLERPDAGEVRVGDLPLATYLALPPDEKPFRIAMVFQSAALLASLSVRDNVALRLRERGRLSGVAIDAIVADALAQVELSDALDRFPGDLSGGMRKRVAIARALAIDPELILYDEPTAELDPILTEQIAGLIRQIHEARGSTQVVVTHNLPLARAIADRVAVLADGRVVDCCPPSALPASTHPLTREFLRAATLGT